MDKGEFQPADKDLELCDLPDSLLLEVFSFLSAEQLGNVSRTCFRFCRVVRDDLLWKDLFYRHYKIPAAVTMHPGATTWREEYVRLHDQSPAVLCEEVKKHKDQVLHVSFSHNGKMFATSSKDGRIMVWNTDYPCTLRFSANMTKDFSWRYTQFSQFNKTDTLLLVSGVHYGNMNTSGEIAVFDLKDFEPQCRVVNKPYDVFGTWYDTQHLLSGTLYWTGHLNSISALWLNKASQAVESERESVMMCLYRFQNINASSIRTIMVADCPLSTAPPLAAKAVCEKCGRPQLESGFSALSASGAENLNTNNSNVCDKVSGLKTRSVRGMDATACDENDGQESEQSTCEQPSKMEWTDNTGNGAVEVEDRCCFCQNSKLDSDMRDHTKRDGVRDADRDSACDAEYRDGGASPQPVRVRLKQGTGHCPVHFPLLPMNLRLQQGAAQQSLNSDADSADPSLNGAETSVNMWCCCQKVSCTNTSPPAGRQHGQQKPAKALLIKNGVNLSAQPSTYRSQEQCSTTRDLSQARLDPPQARPDPSQATPNPSQAKPEPSQARPDPTQGTPDPSQTRWFASVPCIPGLAGGSSRKCEQTEKLLIFTMGEETYTPHLIGIKRMRLQELLGQRVGGEGLSSSGESRLLPNVDENLQGMDRPKDEVDHIINMHGHIVGMALSPDHRYLYVNSRQWPHNYTIHKVLEPPPIAQEIDIHVIDLQTLTEVGTIMRSHKAYTPNDECFFLFLDISDHYVASGAEDKHGYLWDRHYGVSLSRFPHTDVVNGVAFNPQDEEMLVTVSDDFRIKIWRSRRQMRQLGLPLTSP